MKQIVKSKEVDCRGLILSSLLIFGISGTIRIFRKTFFLRALQTTTNVRVAVEIQLKCYIRNEDGELGTYVGR